MTMPPKRILQHEIDSETCKIVASLFILVVHGNFEI